MAMEEETKVDFSEIPVHALNVSVRIKLSNMLNPEIPMFERDRYARDFRGLAELMGFGHNDIMNFQRYPDPTREVMHACGKSHKISDFIRLLEKIQRYDVINDLMPHIIQDCNLYLSRSQFSQPVQVSEISTCADWLPLTIHDTNELATFDAYICYADSDIKFIRWLAEKLETPATGIRLCIRERDLILGTLEYNTFVRIVQERCQRIIIVLSPDFLKTPECDHQAKYAASLACEQQTRRLIPIIYKPCDTPAILRYISKVDFSRVEIQDWIWNKLIKSIKSPTTELFVPTNSNSGDCHPDFESIPRETDDTSLNVLALPDPPTTESSLNLASTSSAEDNQYSSTQSSERVALVDSAPAGNKRQKLVQKFRNFIGSSTSSGSSGFHSQSSNA